MSKEDVEFKVKPVEERERLLEEEIVHWGYSRWHAFDDRDILDLISNDTPPDTIMRTLTAQVEARKARNKVDNTDKRRISTVNKQLDRAYDAHERAVREWAIAIKTNYLKTYKNYTILVVEYSDNDSDFETILEHGNIFYTLTHERISKH